MTPPPTDALGLAALVFVLGLKHGFDPDHLVAIDGLTRSSQSRWCGLYFSLGHGLAVTLVGVAVTLAVTRWDPPAWLQLTGAAISIAVLLVLAFLNLVALRSKWLPPVRHPALIASVGATFAVSFDTVSHALLFSLNGAGFAALLGMLFTLGMVITDAANGWWVAKMIGAADRRAAAAARGMSGVIAGLCLLLAGMGFVRYFRAEIEYASLLSLGSLAAIGAVSAWAVLRFRSVYREAGS
jgi:nickel/cobalt transporter (NiCoT) family protein